jgi:hypothetical protein
MPPFASSWWRNKASFPPYTECSCKKGYRVFFNEYERRKATGQNHDKKHYHQKIVNHTNNNPHSQPHQSKIRTTTQIDGHQGPQIDGHQFPCTFPKNMSLNHQTMGVLLSYGQQLTMKKKHST